MKKIYLPPKSTVVTVESMSMIAASTDRIPVGDGTTPPAAPAQRGEWGNLWTEDSIILFHTK